MLAKKLQEAAGNGADATLYVDDVFSTWLYTGNGSTQTITNGIDLAGKGGMVWIKDRSRVTDHTLYDTVRGVNKILYSDATAAQDTTTASLTAFNSNGFSIDATGGYTNINGDLFASWTFRKAAKFFDVVTYTGTGSARTIAHNLGVAPGMIIVKRTDTTGNWQVYSNGMTSAAYSMQLNLTDPQASAPTVWNSTAPTSSVFSVGTDSTVNASGGTYVAYLYAHDTSSTGIIQCGSYGGNGNIPGPTVSLGWEPQYILVKRATGVNTNWAVFDVMRGMPVSTAANAMLVSNTADAEFSSGFVKPNATGFQITDTSGGFNSSGNTYIYMAIRRPNKPPTTGTQVFGLNARTGTGANATVTGGQTDDAVLIKNRGSAIADLFSSRLTGTKRLVTSNGDAELEAGTSLQANPWDVMDGIKVGTTSNVTNFSSHTYINYLFKRAPGFFDEVCWSGDGTYNPRPHNLGVTPELIIEKSRSNVTTWYVCNGIIALELNTAVAAINYTSTFTSTTFTPASQNNGYTYVAYLFATLAGISKVGSYTGNGTGQAIACGFGAAGARFVLIKRTDAAGNWYTFDSARGLTSGSSPYLLLNSTAAEVTGNNGVYASSGGFTLGSTASTTTNISGASYIFLSVS
jgi:hypothetical protein